MATNIDDALWCYERTRASPLVLRWLRRFEEHDSAFFRHSLLVGAVASVFAWSIELPGHDHESFVTGALLHDVGKLMIAPTLLHKRGPFSVQERIEMEAHATCGHAMLQSEGLPSDVLDIVHLHHERMDGSGYPNAFHGDQLSQVVRMIAICDMFSALVEDRPYRPRPARPLEIMLSMTDILDEALVQRFATDVASLAYQAKDHLDSVVRKPRFAHVS